MGLSRTFALKNTHMLPARDFLKCHSDTVVHFDAVLIFICPHVSVASPAGVGPEKRYFESIPGSVGTVWRLTVHTHTSSSNRRLFLRHVEYDETVAQSWRAMTSMIYIVHLDECLVLTINRERSKFNDLVWTRVV